MNPGSQALETMFFTQNLTVGVWNSDFWNETDPNKSSPGPAGADLYGRNMERKQARGLAMELRVADRW